MRTITVVLFFIFFIATSVTSAEIVITLKNNNALKWQNYIEENNQYCTLMNYGKVCIPKNDVVSIKKNEEKEGAKNTPESDIKKVQQENSRTTNVLNPETIIKKNLCEPQSWELRSLKYKDGVIICGASFYWAKLLPVWYAKGREIYAVNGAANSISQSKYDFVSSGNSAELGTSISKIVTVCEK